MGPKYPVLPYGMDPDCLEARVAFHLRRLDFTSEQRPQGIKFTTWRDYFRARTKISANEVVFIAQKIHADPQELTRALTPEEHDAYMFYQNAHMHHLHVASRLQYTSKEMGWGGKQTLAEWASITPAMFSYLIHQQTKSRGRPACLQYQQAQGIAEHLKPEGGPWFVFDGAASPMPQQSKTFLSPTELPVHSPLTQTMYKKTRTPER